MSNEIGPLLPRRPVATTADSRTATPVATANVGPAPGSSDTVTVTSAAEKRLQMEKALQILEPTDPQRVATIRAALDNGTFRVDADKIAQRLLEMEKDLF